MKGGFKQIIGILVLILIFLLVMIVLSCNISSDIMICPMFQPFLDLVDSIVYTGR